MGACYSRQLVEGVTIPAIIHNSGYFLISMAVYENGTVSCWHKSDLIQFKEDLRKGWVVPAVPRGKELSVHGLGDFPVRDTRWKHDAHSFYRRVEDTVRCLNPEMANLYRTTQREIDKWNEARVQWSASPTPRKRGSGFLYTLLDGNGGYVFYRREGTLCLSFLTAYADKTLQLDDAGDRFFTPEEIDKLFEDGILLTAPAEEEWVSISGLGEVLLAPPDFGPLPVQEKRKEIAENVSRAAGEPDAHDRCIEAYHEYLVEPGDRTRENLRKAYEAVPEHERIYLGDMDSRDSDFIRILYNPDIKREV